MRIREFSFYDDLELGRLCTFAFTFQFNYHFTESLNLNYQFISFILRVES